MAYADDVKIWSKIDCAADVLNLQSEVNKILAWSQQTGQHINVEKCFHMRLGPVLVSLRYTIGKNEIQRVDSVADLGIIWHHSLKTRLDTRRRCAKGRQMLHLIKSSFSHLSPPSFKVLYNALVRPHIEFGVQASHPMTKGEMDDLEALLRRGSKLCR